MHQTNSVQLPFIMGFVWNNTDPQLTGIDYLHPDVPVSLACQRGVKDLVALPLTLSEGDLDLFF